MRRPDRPDRTHVAPVSDVYDEPTTALPPVSVRRSTPPPVQGGTELRSGQLVSEHYVVERVVGTMGACVLVKVRHARLGQRCVLKHLTAETARKPEAIQRFIQSARNAMRLSGDHIARTVDAGYLASGLPYVVSEAFQGSELRDVLRVRGALTPTEAVDFTLQAAEAVAEAHRHGLPHGSLSPSTLFVTRRSDGLPIIKVLDFASADTLRGDPLSVRQMSWDQGTAVFWESSRLWDTLAYSAPEQLRGGDATPLADVWALGATLYELLLGRAPFQGASATSLLATVVADPPAPFGARGNELPAGLEAIVLRCLVKEPELRFPSVADLGAALAAFGSEETRLTVDRIARILSYDAGQVPLSNSSRAIVRVGPSPASPAPTRPSPPPLPASPVAERARGFQPLLVALLTALGILAGTVGGALVARNAMPRVNPPSSALSTAIAAATPAPSASTAPHALSSVSPAKPVVRTKAAAPKPAAPAPAPAPAPTPAPQKAAGSDELFNQMW